MSRKFPTKGEYKLAKMAGLGAHSIDFNSFKRFRLKAMHNELNNQQRVPVLIKMWNLDIDPEKTVEDVLPEYNTDGIYNFFLYHDLLGTFDDYKYIRLYHMHDSGDILILAVLTEEQLSLSDMMFLDHRPFTSKKHFISYI